MALQEVVYLIIWLIVSFGVAFFLKRKYGFFRKFLGVLVLLVSAILFSLIHNFGSALLGFEEAVSFFLALLAFGAGVFLFILLIAERITKLLMGKTK